MSGKVENAAVANDSNQNDRLEALKTWLPVISSVGTAALTAVFGFIIWNAQRYVQASVDNNNALIEQQNKIQLAQLQAQLALKETFYKRRLEVYEQACQQIAAAENVLAGVGVSKEGSDKATDLVASLDNFRRGNQLYWSQPLDKDLSQLWGLGIKKLKKSGAPEGDALSGEITKAVAALHAQMKTDLNVIELAKTLQEANRTSPEGK